VNAGLESEIGSDGTLEGYSTLRLFLLSYGGLAVVECCSTRGRELPPEDRPKLLLSPLKKSLVYVPG
jgi:hypothetical protein